MLQLTDYPIAKQLTWLNLLVTTVAPLLTCSAFLVYDVISSRHALVRNVSMQALMIGSNTVSALVFDYPKSAEDTLSASRASRNVQSQRATVEKLAAQVPNVKQVVNELEVKNQEATSPGKVPAAFY